MALPSASAFQEVIGSIRKNIAVMPSATISTHSSTLDNNTMLGTPTYNSCIQYPTSSVIYKYHGENLSQLQIDTSVSTKKAQRNNEFSPPSLHQDNKLDFSQCNLVFEQSNIPYNYKMKFLGENKQLVGVSKDSERSDRFGQTDICFSDNGEVNKFQLLKKNLTDIGNSIRKDVLFWKRQVNFFSKSASKAEKLLNRNNDENELYRSNSFKYQKGRSAFCRPLLRQPKIDDLEVFDDYSHPVDLVVRQHGWTGRNSLDELEDVTICEEYCDPVDLKAYCQPGDETVTKLYTSPDLHDYTQPCSDNESITSEEENSYEYIGVPEQSIWKKNLIESLLKPSGNPNTGEDTKENLTTCPIYSCHENVESPLLLTPLYENVTYILIDSGTSGSCETLNSESPSDWPDIDQLMAQHWISFLRERQTRDRCKKEKKEGTGVSWLRRLCHRSHSDGILHRQDIDKSLQKSDECLDQKSKESRVRVLQRSQSVAVENGRGQGTGLEQGLKKESRSLDAILEDEGSSVKSNQLYVTAFDSQVEVGVDCHHDVSNDPSRCMSPMSSHSSPGSAPLSPPVHSESSKSERLRKLFANRPLSLDSSGSDLSSPRIVQKVTSECPKLSQPSDVSVKRSFPTDLALSTPSPPSSAPLPIKFRDKKLTVIRSTPNLSSELVQSPATTCHISADAKDIERTKIIPKRPPLGVKAPVLASNRPVLELVSASSSTLSSLESLRSSRSDESSMSRATSGLSTDSSCSSLNNSLLMTPPVKPPRRTLMNSREGQLRYRNKKPSPIIEDVSREIESEINRNIPILSDEPSTEALKLITNKNLLGAYVTNWDVRKDVQGSDSGISVEFQQGPTTDSFCDLPFDMPKLRRKAMSDVAPSEDDTDIDNLPFDMPKLRRRRNNSVKIDSIADKNFDENGKPNKNSLTLSFSAISPKKTKLGLQLNLTTNNSSYLMERIDVSIPLERQGWYHGAITRVDAENLLRVLKEGSYLVRNSESSRQGYSLSLKSVRGFMHMRIVRDSTTNKYILGQFSKPFDSIPEMIVHYSRNKLPIKGAEHMSLVHPVVDQLL